MENKRIEPAKDTNIDKITWCDLVKPSEAELMEVSQKFKVGLDDLEDCLDESIRPRFTSDRILSNQMLVLRITTITEIDYSKPSTEPLGVIFTNEKKVITVHLSVPLYFNKLLDSLQKEQPVSEFMLLCEIIHYMIDPMEAAAQKVGAKIRELEKIVVRSDAPKAMLEPFQMNAYFIYFETAMLGNLNALKLFKHKNAVSEKDENVLEKLDDISTDIEQVFSYATIFRASLANILDAYASVINNNLTTVMKVVGSLNLIIGIPTLVASVFGQNLFFGFALPDDRDPWPFIIITLLTSVVTAILYKRFRKSKWL
nr:magnesium transporter CorA family protein [Candidatus Sigynarchaeota archaeon]